MRYLRAVLALAHFPPTQATGPLKPGIALVGPGFQSLIIIIPPEAFRTSLPRWVAVPVHCTYTFQESLLVLGLLETLEAVAQLRDESIGTHAGVCETEVIV